jgi:hypothetical protein
MSDKPRLIADYEHEISRLADERNAIQFEADICRALLVTLVRYIDGELTREQAQATIDIARQEWADAQQRERNDA